MEEKKTKKAEKVEKTEKAESKTNEQIEKLTADVNEYKEEIRQLSFFDELDGKTLSKEELLEIHDKKALEFLKKH